MAESHEISGPCSSMELTCNEGAPTLAGWRRDAAAMHGSENGEGSMKGKCKCGWQRFASAISILMLGLGIGAGEAAGASWKEEVLLHDGRKMLVERSQTRGGRREIGQEIPVARHGLWFSIPETGRTIEWETEFGLEIEKTSLVPLAIEIVGTNPYLVATPAGCIAYNKWDRPNPPYVLFRFDGKEWQRTSVAQMPGEIKGANVVIGALTLATERRLTAHPDAVSANEVATMNAEARNPDVLYLREFVRQPIKVAQTDDCGEMAYDGKGGWVGVGWFRDQPSLDACLRYCARNQIEPGYCRCNQFFKGKE